MSDEFPKEAKPVEEPIDMSLAAITAKNSSLATYIVPVETTEVSSNTLDTDVVKADVQIANGVLRAVAAGWNNVKTLADVKQLANLTLDVVERRRKLLNQQHGPSSDTKKLNLNDYVS